MKPQRRRILSAVLLLTVLLALSSCMRSPEAKSAKFVEVGKSLLQKNDPARAILQFRNATKTWPGNAEAYYQLGMAYLASRDYRAAVASFQKALAINPKHVEAQLRIAQLMAGTTIPERLQEAQGQLQALMESGVPTTEMLNTLALTQIKLGSFDNAVQTLQKALAEFPPELTTYVMLAQAKIDQQDAGGAENALKDACKALPRSSDAHRILADFYIAQKRYADAEPELRLAIAGNPRGGRALYDLGRLQMTAGQKAAAEGTFRQLATLEGYRPIYGVFLFHEARPDEGLRELETAGAANPADRQVRSYLLAAYRALNRPADVDRILAAALKRNGRDVDALQQRAEIAMEKGNLKQAETDLNTLLRLDTTRPEVHYLRGNLHRLRGETESYRQELAETLRRNPALLAVRLELARAMISANQPQAAVDTLDAAPSRHKSTLEFILARNWGLWGKGDLAEMRKGIDAGLARGRTADFLVQDGLWKLRSGNPAGARLSLEEALKSVPSNVTALQALRSAYAAQKNPGAGLEKVKEYAGRAKDSAPVQNYLGQVLLESGRVADARAAFDAAKAAAPDSITPELGLSKVDYTERRLNDGRARLQKILSRDPGNLTAQLWLGIFQQASGDYKTAISLYRNVLDREPDQAQAANNLAYLLAEHENNLDEALKLAQRAVERSPDTPAYSDTLGWILCRKGLYAAALQYLERSGTQTDQAIWKYHLAIAYAKTGDVRRGKATFSAALKLDPNVPEAKLAREAFSSSR